MSPKYKELLRKRSDLLDKFFDEGLNLSEAEELEAVRVELDKLDTHLQFPYTSEQLTQTLHLHGTATIINADGEVMMRIQEQNFDVCDADDEE